MKKIIFTGILFLGLVMTGFAQSDKMKEKAKDKVEEINTQIVSVDKSLALSDTQRKEIYDLFLKSLMEVKAVTKDGGDKDDKKEARQKYMKQIYSEILTKEQKKARRESKQ